MSRVMTVTGLLRRRLRELRDDRSGAVLVELAFVFPLLMLLIVGIIEVAMILFVSMLLEGSVREAARYGITGYVVEGVSRIEQIRNIVAANTIGLVDMDEVTIDTLTYESFSAIGQPEPFDDENANGEWDEGEAFNDVNGNGQWDPDMGIAGAGTPGDIVVYRVVYDWPLITGMLARTVGTNILLRASYAVRNEPWDIGIVGGE